MAKRLLLSDKIMIELFSLLLLLVVFYARAHKHTTARGGGAQTVFLLWVSPDGRTVCSLDVWFSKEGNTCWRHHYKLPIANTHTHHTHTTNWTFVCAELQYTRGWRVRKGGRTERDSISTARQWATVTQGWVSAVEGRTFSCTPEGKTRLACWTVAHITQTNTVKDTCEPSASPRRTFRGLCVQDSGICFNLFIFFVSHDICLETK